MNNNLDKRSPQERMKGYLEKVASGPRMSKDLTAEEAADGLGLVLNGEVSPERAAVFMIATRMKLETVEENLGFFRALDAVTEKRRIGLPRLLQVTEAFDGFGRVPGFGFFVLPVLAGMGLPAFGLSSLPMPPKFGITFEDLLCNHYKKRRDHTLEDRVQTIEQFGFGYLSTAQCAPRLEALREMRVEIVKRPMLATLEKMLSPLQAEKTFLATNYFHPGYEVSMLEVARETGFDRVIVGNGMEGTTLYGVHKTGKIFRFDRGRDVEEKRLDLESLFGDEASGDITQAFADLKEVPCTRDMIARLGEEALAGKENAAFHIMAVHAAILAWLVGVFPEARIGLAAARETLLQGTALGQFREYLASLPG